MTLKILLVDDNPTFMMAVSQFLTTLPNAQLVGQAYDGREALAKVERLKPDLILLDISMPGMSGLEVARCLRGQSNQASIVFLSMHDCPDYRTAAANLDVTGFIGKGNLAAELPPMVERLFRTKSGGSASC